MPTTIVIVCAMFCCYGHHLRQFSLWGDFNSWHLAAWFAQSPSSGAHTFFFFLWNQCLSSCPSIASPTSLCVAPHTPAGLLLPNLPPTSQPSSLPDLVSEWLCPSSFGGLWAWTLALQGRLDHLIVFSSVVRLLFNSWVFLLRGMGQVTPAYQVTGLDEETDLQLPRHSEFPTFPPALALENDSVFKGTI